jgi:hypothetical protein
VSEALAFLSGAFIASSMHMILRNVSIVSTIIVGIASLWLVASDMVTGREKERKKLGGSQGWEMTVLQAYSESHA